MASATSRTSSMVGAIAPGRGSPVRVIVWALHAIAPLLGLWLLIARPEVDLRWANHEAHFVLVLVTALIGTGLGVAVGQAAQRRADLRLFLVSLAFLSSAGFLGLHALATPGVILQQPNTGFAMAAPVGLALGGFAAAASAVEWSGAARATLHRHRRTWLALTWLLLAAWAVVSLADLPPLSLDPSATGADAVLPPVAVVGAALYAGAAVRYLLSYRRRPAVILLSLLTAYVLLAEAMVTMVFARSWQASWWLWHVLMTLAFGFIAYSAHVQFRREGTAQGLFDAITLRETVAHLQRDYLAALEAMVEAVRRRGQGGAEPVAPSLHRLAERFGLTEQQVAVLGEAAGALGREREQVRRLDNLAAIGSAASVDHSEDDLLERAQDLTAAAFEDDRVRLRLLRDGRLGDGAATPEAEHAVTTLTTVASPDGSRLVLPLVLKGRAAGVLEVERSAAEGFTLAERALLESFAGQTSIALENARLYHQLDGLFRSYMSPDVATALIADPGQAGLGGRVEEVSVLMADLRGFTPFAERTEPAEVVAMLNSYYGVVVPVVLDAGGTVVQFVGDAIMAIFNAPVRQADHAHRAARAGLHLQREVAAVAGAHDDWPRFRVGINSGPALVGNIGARQMRNFTAIGDTTNLAARLEGLAAPGAVVIGPHTRELLGDAARVTWQGDVDVKGKSEPVPVHVLHDLGSR